MIPRRGEVRVANVYRDRQTMPKRWHPSRYDAVDASNFVERHTGRRLAYRVVARFK